MRRGHSSGLSPCPRSSAKQVHCSPDSFLLSGVPAPGATWTTDRLWGPRSTAGLHGLRFPRRRRGPELRVNSAFQPGGWDQPLPQRAAAGTSTVEGGCRAGRPGHTGRGVRTATSAHAPSSAHMCAVSHVPCSVCCGTTVAFPHWRPCREVSASLLCPYHVTLTASACSAYR